MIKINTAKIRLATNHPLNSMQRKRKPRVKRINSTIYSKMPLVMPNQTSETYDLYLGATLLYKTLLNGITEIECELLTAPSQQTTSELFILENYLCNASTALALGAQLRTYRKEYKLTKLDLSRRLGITISTIHQYESLTVNLDKYLVIELENENLQFKEARSIADLNSHTRQRAVAQPFIDGRLSSVQVEKLVQVVRVLSDVPVNSIVNKFLELFNSLGKEITSKQVINALKSTNPKDSNVSNETLQDSILKMAGLLANLSLCKIPHSKRSPYITNLRILDARLHLALTSLNDNTADIQKPN